MRDAVRLGASSVGHGRFATVADLRAAFSKDRKRPVAIESCPVSNCALGYVSSLQKHPLREQLRQGLNVNLGTDDPLFFTASRYPYTEQLYLLWQSGQLTSWEQLKTLLRNGCQWPLIPAAQRAALRADVERQLRAIEADPHSQRVIREHLTAR